ncbi:multicopper oxidase family protein [Nakamurella sp. GG22]
MTEEHIARPAGVGRRTVFKAAGAGFGLYFLSSLGGRPVAVQAAAPEGSTLLQPDQIPKFATPVLIPPAMPKAGVVRTGDGAIADYYEISVRQFQQQILPASLPPTTVWGYGPHAGTGQSADALHHAPSLTIEAQWGRPVRVRWINELMTRRGRSLPHLLPVDPTLHWANPAGGIAHRDSRPTFDATPGPYRGPVPTVTHVHGSVGVGDESDGYPEAWYLPAAADIPAGFARQGTWYDFFKGKARRGFGASWRPGSATFQYPNSQRASTLWYHDHTLGMTRLNVYAGPAGFFLIRGGPEGDDAVRDVRTGRRAVLPGPAPGQGNGRPRKSYAEIPLAIQDRSFNKDGSLFYPDSREFFDGTVGPYIPAGDLPPIWNPEFFGNTLMVNGATWPHLTVQRKRYRFRLLNGCDARFLVLDFTRIPGVKVWQIGSEGGFLPVPVDVTRKRSGRLLMAPAERADVIVDFSRVPIGRHILGNVGPDEPFGGGEPDDDFDRADPDSTGQVLEFRVVRATGHDPSTPPEFLSLPRIRPLTGGVTRRLALVEEMSMDAEDAPIAALLGTVGDDGRYTARMWSEPLTENPAPGATELWEIYNTTADAHPMHVHDVFFQLVNRQPIVVDEVQQRVDIDVTSAPRGPEPAETGWKDTVIAYPGEVTRIRMRFGKAGQFVWHCHIVEHEDNEMMRPMRIGPAQPGQPTGHHMS